MRAIAIVGALFTLLAGSACLTVSGRGGSLTPGVKGPGAAVGGAPGFPFVSGYELINLPATWYCVSPWSEDPGQERRGMELFAWRLFIALNWPGRVPYPGGWTAERELNRLNARGVYPRWNSWYTPEQIYRSLNDDPDDDSPELDDPLGWSCHGDCLTDSLRRGAGEASEQHRVVYDQNGQTVLYEVRLDDRWHETLMNAVVAEASAQPTANAAYIDFRTGQCKARGPDSGADTFDFVGTMAIKLAWKRLSEAESKSGRFLQRLASPPPSGPGAGDGKIRLGLIGFHIMQKSKPYGDWIWSTFEHVDNLTPAEAPSGPSFNDPRCDASTCRPNASKQVHVNGSTVCRTQITRVDPIPPEVQKLNAQARDWLKSNDTVLQHYQLIGVQYKPHSGSKPEPATLRNSVIETYIVGSSAPGGAASRGPCDIEPVARRSSCLGCHRAVKAQDFSFVPTLSLCNCEDKEKRWIGDRYCELLGVSSKCGAEEPARLTGGR